MHTTDQQVVRLRTELARGRTLEQAAMRAGMHRNTAAKYASGALPWENGYGESFIGRLRDEHLNLELFTSLLEAQVVTEDWRIDYNESRPHGALRIAPPRRADVPRARRRRTRDAGSSCAVKPLPRGQSAEITECLAGLVLRYSERPSASLKLRGEGLPQPLSSCIQWVNMAWPGDGWDCIGGGSVENSWDAVEMVREKERGPGRD